MGFEIPIDSDYSNHPKTVGLIALLKRPEADVYPFRLFMWAAKFARNGEIKVVPEVLEAALKWPGKPGELVHALRKVGFIEKRKMVISGWMDRIGRALYIYEVKKFNQRKKYAERNGIEFKDDHPSVFFFKEVFRKNAAIRDVLDDRDTLDIRGEEDPAGLPEEKPPASAAPPPNGMTADAYRQLPDGHPEVVKLQVGLLIRQLKDQKIQGSPQQIQAFAEARVANPGFEKSQVIIEKAGDGHDVLYLNRQWFEKGARK